MKKILVFLIIAVGIIFVWYNLSLRPPDPNSVVRHTVRISAGASVTTIAKLLEAEDIVRSALAFRMYMRWNEPDMVLQAGSFVLRPSMSIQEIIATLSGGIAQEGIVTIPEGFTVKEIDQLLVQRGLIEEGELVRCANECDFSGFEFLPQYPPPQSSPEGGGAPAGRGGRVEGYLFPDTYFVLTDGFVPKFFLERLLSTFGKRVIEPHRDTITKSGRTLHQIVTMASLIEKETRTETERPIVSGILWKRYDASKGLEADAAVRYILEKPTKILTAADLNSNSPYNIRKFRGLPPGPIANPGLSSFLAALHPKESRYWYYLHGNDGVIRYAVTNEEHNVNRYKYLR